MKRLLLALMALCCTGAVHAQSLDDLQAQDTRLAQIADRMMAANTALCTEAMPITGMVLHSADQYDEAAAGVLLPNGPVGLALVLPGSPAERAGLREGDGLLSIGGQDVSALSAPEDGYIREAAFELLSGQPADAPLTLVARRGDETFTATLNAPIGCRTLVEIVTGNGVMGRSDGKVIQISYNFAVMLDDDGLAAIFAHELGHTVLHHRARLEAAGVRKGLLGEFGRNRRLNRQVEEEADLISAHLLANAGYDPALAPAFWRSATGRRVGGGLIRSGAYASPKARADMIEEEIAGHIPGGRGPIWPEHLLSLRDQPFAQ